MPTPRRESIKGPTSASSYILECKLRRAYEAQLTQAVAHLHRPEDRRAVYVQLLGGKLAATQIRGAEKRLHEGMIDVLLRLDADQQQVVKALLLDPPAPDLAAVIAELVRLERNINYRDDDPRLSINDDARLKAAGMGRLTQQQYELSKPKYANLGEPLVLEPLRPAARPVLRTRKRGRRKVRVLPRVAAQYELWPLPAGMGMGGGL